MKAAATPPEPVKAMDSKIISPDIPAKSQDSIWSRWKSFYGLIWCEWYSHGKFLLFFLATWLACTWALPLYANPAWILLFGVLFAVIAGPLYGGSDTIEGCEEFTFSLPPTRGERYLARLAVGGGALLLITGMDLLALGLDLSQILAKLYVDSGLIRPWPIFKSGLLYGLVLALPAAIFAFSFVTSAITHSRALVLSASFWALLISLAALRVGFWYEDLVWDNLNGWFSCPLLALLAAVVLCGGYLAYKRKEIGPNTTPVAIPARWWLWAMLFVAGLILAMTLAASLAKHYSRVFTSPQKGEMRLPRR